MKQQLLSKPKCVVCWNLIESVQALRWVLLKTNFYCLYDPSNLIFGTPTFMNIGLKMAEQIFGYDNVVQKIIKNAFQGYENT